jgi:hypothetical protein
MPTFLSDPAPGFYLVLVAFVLIAGVMAARKQDRRNVVTFGAAIAMILIVFTIDYLTESPREEAVRRVEEMAQAADSKNPDAFISHLADRIEYQAGSQSVTRTKEEVRTSSFWDMLRQLGVRVVVWDFARHTVKEIDANTIEIGFMGKGEAQGQQFPVYIRATFAKQPDGQYRLTRFASFNPANHNDPLPIPRFP